MSASAPAPATTGRPSYLEVARSPSPPKGTSGVPMSVKAATDAGLASAGLAGVALFASGLASASAVAPVSPVKGRTSPSRSRSPPRKPSPEEQAQEDDRVLKAWIASQTATPTPAGGADAGNAPDAPTKPLREEGSGGGNGGASELWERHPPAPVPITGKTVTHGPFTAWCFSGCDAGALTSNFNRETGKMRDEDLLHQQIANLAELGATVVVDAGAAARGPEGPVEPTDNKLVGPYHLRRAINKACHDSNINVLHPERVEEGHPTYIYTTPAPEDGQPALDMGTGKAEAVNGAVVPKEYRKTDQAQLINQAKTVHEGDEIPHNELYLLVFNNSTGVKIIFATGELRALAKVDPRLYRVCMAILQKTLDMSRLAGVPIQLADYMQEAVDGARGMLTHHTFPTVIRTVFGGVIPPRFAVAAVGAGSTQLCIVDYDADAPAGDGSAGAGSA